jgi:hypothetical protein
MDGTGEHHVKHTTIIHIYTENMFAIVELFDGDLGANGKEKRMTESEQY